MNPPSGSTIVPLAIPLFITAGAIAGTAVAIIRAEDGMWYLVDNAATEGPPLWVHEAQIERCVVSAIRMRTD